MVPSYECRARDGSVPNKDAEPESAISAVRLESREQPVESAVALNRSVVSHLRFVCMIGREREKIEEEERERDTERERDRRKREKREHKVLSERDRDAKR